MLFACLADRLANVQLVFGLLPSLCCILISPPDFNVHLLRPGRLVSEERGARLARERPLRDLAELRKGLVHAVVVDDMVVQRLLLDAATQ